MGPFTRQPDPYLKLDVLAGSARYDVCLASCSTNALGKTGRFRDPENPLTRWLYPAHVPGKGEVHILKILQTNVCVNSCVYCSLSCRSDSERRMTFSPDELSGLFMDFVRRRLAHGIFLSSGIAGTSESSMERMIATAEILRKRYSYSGYIHLKVLPGVSTGLIDRAARFADRLSMNLEAPTREHLARIAPGKDFVRDLVAPMRKTAAILAQGVRARSQTTQFVVGCSDETDLDIMKTTDWLYREASVFRAYFSAYQQGSGSAGAGGRRACAGGQAENPLLREHRLYQADFLLRGYGFRLPDLVFDGSGKFPLNIDPKTAHAMMHPELFPVNVNTAELELLLRVPGIGPVSARRIVEHRGTERLGSPGDLKALGVRTSQAEPYLEFPGTRGSPGHWHQSLLFEDSAPADWVTGIAPAGRSHGESFSAAGTVSAAGEAPGAQRAVYPGQEGKLLHYSGKKGIERVFCR